MTGKQFKSIRRFNRISQNDFSYNSGLCGRTTLHFVEKLELVPQKYVIEVSNGFEWRFITQKTKETNIIPLMPKVMEILEKYDYKIPQISIQKFNLYIKEIAELANINTPITTLSIVGGKKVEETNPKFKLIGTHTARRTFITISLINGMPSEIVKKISGHKSDKEFQKYIEIASNIKRTEMEKIWK